MHEQHVEGRLIGAVHRGEHADRPDADTVHRRYAHPTQKIADLILLRSDVQVIFSPFQVLAPVALIRQSGRTHTCDRCNGGRRQELSSFHVLLLLVDYQFRLYPHFVRTILQTPRLVNIQHHRSAAKPFSVF